MVQEQVMVILSCSVSQYNYLLQQLYVVCINEKCHFKKLNGIYKSKCHLLVRGE